MGSLLTLFSVSHFSLLFRVKNAWYIVRFTEVGSVQIGEDAVASLPSIKTALEIVLKNRMIGSSLKVDGRSPHMFYLPYDQVDAKQILGDCLFGAYYFRDGVSELVVRSLSCVSLFLYTLQLSHVVIYIFLICSLAETKARYDSIRHND